MNKISSQLPPQNAKTATKIVTIAKKLNLQFESMQRFCLFGAENRALCK